jgi:hypothetical protein
LTWVKFRKPSAQPIDSRIWSRVNGALARTLRKTTRNNNPPAKAYQQAIFPQGQPAVMFYTDDIMGYYERIQAHGAEFTMPPTEVTGSTSSRLNDTCGNLTSCSR